MLQPMSTQEDLLQQHAMTSRHSRQINFGYPPERDESDWYDEADVEVVQRRRRLGRTLSVRRSCSVDRMEVNRFLRVIEAR